MAVLQDERLTARLRKAVESALTDYYRYDLKTELPPTAVDDTMYEQLLGAFIVRQNPYAVKDKLVLPEIPLDSDAETRWIRKSGLLRDNTAFNPLPHTEVIPAGPVVDFSYEYWPHLREPDHGETNPPPPDQFISVDNPGVIDPTLDRYKEYRAGTPLPYPPDKSTHYGHHVVKSVRLRYTVKDRRKPLPPGVELDDREAGYILILYSGSDS